MGAKGRKRKQREKVKHRTGLLNRLIENNKKLKRLNNYFNQRIIIG